MKERSTAEPCTPLDANSVAHPVLRLEQDLAAGGKQKN